MFLALKEIRRARWRFLLLAGAIGLLVFLVLFQNGLKDGLITQFIGALRNQSAPVLVYDAQARKNLEGSQITDQQLAAIAAVDGVEQVGRIGEGTFTVTTPVWAEEEDPRDQLGDAVIFGYDLDTGLGAPTTLSSGRLPEGPGEAVASAGNESDGFRIGDVVRVQPDGLEIEIVGLADDTNYSVSPVLFTDFATYEEARKVRNPDATAVQASVAGVQPAPGVSVDELTTRIDDAVPGVQALTRDEAVNGSPGVASVSSSLNTVIFLFLLAALLVIGLFVLIITVQKSSALTLLRAIGAKRWTLARSLLLQTSIVVIAGVVIGAVLLLLALPGVRSIGVEWRVGQVLAFGLIVLVLGLLATLASVWRVLRIDPIEATRSQGVLK